ncbi:MAG: metal ABC transporter substrate-binding protein [Oscillospiraceae bacterium]|nr:metal ABC transporter substrate-binding protein [Oscillospiraceae bacterium]
MKKLIPFLLSLLLLTGCAAQPAETEAETTVACTTYPVYLLAQAVTQGVDEVEPVLVINQQISCLHNYTLTMRDMKTIEACDLLAINGAGLEDFLDDVLEGRDYLDCSQGIELDEGDEDHEEGSGHTHEEEADAHIWLDPARAAQMAANLAEGLAQADPDNAEAYRANAEKVQTSLSDLQAELTEQLAGLSCRQLITFHDGFHYFAQAFDLEIVAAVEEEEGSEASARRINELVALIDQYQIPAIFTEVNGSDSTARALAQERDIGVFALDLGMSSENVPEGLEGLDAYEAILRQNVETILEAYP